MLAHSAARRKPWIAIGIVAVVLAVSSVSLHASDVEAQAIVITTDNPERAPCDAERDVARGSDPCPAARLTKGSDYGFAGHGLVTADGCDPRPLEDAMSGEPSNPAAPELARAGGPSQCPAPRLLKGSDYGSVGHALVYADGCDPRQTGEGVAGP